MNRAGRSRIIGRRLLDRFLAAIAQASLGSLVELEKKRTDELSATKQNTKTVRYELPRFDFKPDLFLHLAPRVA